MAMGIGKKKSEDEEPEEENLEGTEEEAEAEPEPEYSPQPVMSPAMISARDAARVCVIVNQAIQDSGLMDDPNARPEDLEEAKAEASRAAARAAGTWQALENQALPIQVEAARELNIIADEDSLAALSAAVITAARDQLQLILGKVAAGVETVE